ncbi:hypothetical protein B0T14DRAFT_571954 [Immersiella caudata]|uniref:Uncharacterized protein n=1 Tax=Immersiella caudata TaxID=314043 RepID=A0AA39U5E3_9PEZI|nr:hypothetical protein B0T14DRAFT_571954 [Immersiella caudata]
MASSWPLRPLPAQVSATVPRILAAWTFTVWELSSFYPEGQSLEVNFASLPTFMANRDFKLRIIFAPPDAFEDTQAEEVLYQLYAMLSVPDEFKAERKQSVSHSFGSKTLPTETCLWFHFLCKNIDIKSDQKGKVWLRQNKTYGNKPNAAEDYAYVKSGFVINGSLEPGSGGSSPGSTTLVCFGATPNVRSRLDKFTDSADKELACTQPYLFFAPILSGLHADLDDMAWNLNEIFANDEAKLLTGAYEITKLTASDSNIFASLHYLAKYCFVLLETATSLQLVTETIISQLTSPSTPNNTALVESLQHTLTLIQSTHLRLTTLRQRIKNAITLAFNLNADKDTKIMMDDSHAMRVIAFMTAFLLPATAIASILGSNMFDSSDDEGTWTVRVNAAFWMWCVVALPITAGLVFWLVVRFRLAAGRKGRGGRRGEA